MDFLPPDVKESADKLASNWLKASQFDGDGQVLQVSAPLEKVKSQFGAEPDDYLVQNSILSEGESFRYTFTDAEGIDRKIDSASTPFFIAFKQCEELGIGDWVRITRTGTTTKTRYSVEKTEAPVSHAKPDEEIDPSTVPF